MALPNTVKIIKSKRTNLHAKCCGDGSSRVLNSSSVTTRVGRGVQSGNNTEDHASRHTPSVSLMCCCCPSQGPIRARAVSSIFHALYLLCSVRPSRGRSLGRGGVSRGGLATSPLHRTHRAPHPLQPGVTPSCLSKRGSGSSGHKDSSIPPANKGRSVLDGAELLARPAALTPPLPPLAQLLLLLLHISSPPPPRPARLSFEKHFGVLFCRPHISSLPD